MQIRVVQIRFFAGNPIHKDLRIDFALTRNSSTAGCLPHRILWTTVRRRQGYTSRTRPDRIWKRSSRRYVTWRAIIYLAMNLRRMCRWHWPTSNNSNSRRRRTRRQQSLRLPHPLPPLPPHLRRRLPRQHPRNNGYCTPTITSNFTRSSRPSSGPVWSWWSIRDLATPHVPYTEQCIQNDDVLASTARHHRGLSFENEEFLLNRTQKRMRVSRNGRNDSDPASRAFSFSLKELGRYAARCTKGWILRMFLLRTSFAFASTRPPETPSDSSQRVVVDDILGKDVHTPLFTHSHTSITSRRNYPRMIMHAIERFFDRKDKVILNHRRSL